VKVTWDLQGIMKNKVRNQLQRIVPISDELWKAIEPYFYLKKLEKDEFLLQEGDVEKHYYFIVDGILMSYYIKDREEIVYNFWLKNDIAVDTASIVTQLPSRQYIRALTNTTLYILSRKDAIEISKEFQEIQEMLRIAAETAYVYSRNKTVSFLYDSPEERYEKLLKERPNIFKKIPQYYIASYLGIKPQSLSRIRKRLSTK
jgi:CRP-like cAMP-binding protein